MRSLKYSAFLIITAAVAGCSEDHVYHSERVYEHENRPVYTRDRDYVRNDRATYDYDAPRTQTRVEVSGDNASASAGAYADSYSNDTYRSSSSYDDASTDIIVEAPEPDDAQYFEQDLAPYGEWTEVSDYGRVWRPQHVDRDWQPYTRGHWVSTVDNGWLWA